jgi:hypothetical protein
MLDIRKSVASEPWTLKEEVAVAYFEAIRTFVYRPWK